LVDKSNLDPPKEPIKEMPEDQSSDEEIDPLLEEDPIKRECKKMKHLGDWRDT